MFYNLFGWLPSPAIYGAITEATSQIDSQHKNISRWGMVALTQSIVLAVIFVFLAIIAEKLPCFKGIIDKKGDKEGEGDDTGIKY